MDHKELIHIANHHPVGAFDRPMRLGRRQLFRGDGLARFNVTADMMHPSCRLQRVQKCGRPIGAIVGDHHDIGETQAAIPRDPFDNERPFVSHRRDKSDPQFRYFSGGLVVFPTKPDGDEMPLPSQAGLPWRRAHVHIGVGKTRAIGDEHAMKLLVGLGNPGEKYAANRHNIGFMAVDSIARDHGFSRWKRAFSGQISEAEIGGEKVALLKPETFMNLSGQSVAATMRFYKLALPDLVVLHDELDLAPGKCRVKDGGGHAGHNGLRSIHGHLGDAYRRVRLGIGHPGHKDAVADYVLHDFAKSDRDWLDALLQGIADGAPALVAGDAAGFMNMVALRTTPQRPGHGAEPKPNRRNAKTDAVAASVSPSPTPETPDPRSPMQRLLDRFR